MASERPTVSESERTLAAIDQAEDVLAELRGDLASGDTLRVIRWVQNDGALVGPSDALRAAAARIRELEDALNVVRLACEHPANRTSHTQRQMVQFLEHLRKQVVSRLAHTESEDRNG